MTERERLRALAAAVLAYDRLIEETARQRVLAGGGTTGAWSVGGTLGQRLDVAYFALLEKAREALQECP